SSTFRSRASFAGLARIARSPDSSLQRRRGAECRGGGGEAHVHFVATLRRNPMSPDAKDGSLPPETASGPAFVAETSEPPRVSAPGPTPSVLAPTRHIASSLKLAQSAHAVERGTQSATHSSRLPTMSKAPREDTQLLRVPVETRPGPAADVLQSVVPSSGPASGVPFAPTCHSALVGKRFAELAHASCAWNQLMCAEGSSDGRLTA